MRRGSTILACELPYLKRRDVVKLARVQAERLIS